MTLEELFKKLIEKGWKPFGYELLYPNAIEDCFDYDSRKKRCRFLIHKNFIDEVYNSLREVVSKESGLWKFICENKMVQEDSPYYTSLDDNKILCTSDEWICYYNCDGYPKDNYYKLERMYYEFWVVESALCDEDELEQFLLDNIEI